MSRYCCMLLLLTIAAFDSTAAEKDDPIGRELRSILIDDQNAQDRVDELIASNNAFKAEGAGLSDAIMATKVRQIIDPVREQYIAFLQRNPKHVRAHLALASFLQEFGDRENSKSHLDTALTLAPNDPVALNNLGNFHGEFGPPEKAFEYYQRASKAAPKQSMYYRNLASVMIIHPLESQSYFRIADKQGVLRRGIDLFKKAVSLNPDDFLLQSTLAQTYYQMRPFPYQEATNAWERALVLAGTRIEKEGVMIHLARIHIKEKNYDAARINLNGVKVEFMLDLKKELMAKIPKKMSPVSFSTSTAGPGLFNLSTSPPPGASGVREPPPSKKR